MIDQITSKVEFEGDNYKKDKDLQTNHSKVGKKAQLKERLSVIIFENEGQLLQETKDFTKFA